MSFKVALLETCGRVQSVPRAAVQCHDNWNNNLKDESSGGSPCLVVMGDDSCLKGCGFKSRHNILDGHFSH